MPAEGQASSVRSIDPKLLELLVCPVTKSTLVYDEIAQELISAKAGLAFPIRDGVPLMTIETARRLDEAVPKSPRK